MAAITGTEPRCHGLAPAVPRYLALALSGALLALPAPRVVAQSGQPCLYLKWTAARNRQDGFGYALDMHGRALAVGMPGDDWLADGSGSAWFYEWADGVLVFRQRLTLPQPRNGHGFGKALSLGRDVLAICTSHEGRGDTLSGAAYVWEPSDGRWVMKAKLEAGDWQNGDFFGNSVAVQDGLVAVGAPRAYDGYHSGAVYIFERDAEGRWSQTQKLTAAYDRGSQMGSPIALDGDVLVAGAMNDSDRGTWAGAAYVFERGLDRRWRQTAKVYASDSKHSWTFGRTVAVQDDVIFIGATGADWHLDNGGAVYVFERHPATRWRQTAKIKVSGGYLGACFGMGLAVDGPLLLVGDFCNDEVNRNAGAAYVFIRDADGRWVQTGRLLPPEAGLEHHFGYALATSDGLAVIAAPGDDGGGLDAGAAYLYAVSADADGDGVMDACECPGDLDGDRDVDLADLAALLSCLGRGENCADVDEDGRTDGADLAALLAHWGALCPK